MGGMPAVVAHKAESSEVLDHAVRLGLVVYGVVHLVIAGTALQLTWGSSSGTNASQQGAFAQLAKTPLGEAALYGMAVGLLILVGWQLLEVAAGHREHDGLRRVGRRLASAGKAVVYGFLAYNAVSMTMAAGSSSGASTDSWTARLMSAPAGPVLVGAVGAGLLAVGCYLAFTGVSGRFTEALDAHARRSGRRAPIVMLGVVGHVTKGIAFGAVGTLFLLAAVQQQPKESGGLDVALHELMRQPFGQWLVVGVGLGLGCFGLYCLAWARHLDR